MRKEYHLVIGGAIENRSEKDLDEIMGDLAFHFYGSRNPEIALDIFEEVEVEKYIEKVRKEL